MQSILILGAGKSAGYLIDYLSDWSNRSGTQLHIADLHTAHLEHLTTQSERIHLHTAQLSDKGVLQTLIEGKNIVVSMLPAFMHPIVAEICLEKGVNMATASYESEEMRALAKDVEAKGLIFLNECGLDPGLDHMSAMRIIHGLQAKGHQITGFYSYCGGLVAKACLSENPWKYKFSWNPRNVVLAGQSTAKYLENKRVKLVPYHRLFAESTRHEINGEWYDGYPNRDSLSYAKTYGIEGVSTLVRGTLRHEGYCSAWNFLVQLGLTDDSVAFPVKPGMTYREFLEAFLPERGRSAEEKMTTVSGYSDTIAEKIKWLGLLSNEPVSAPSGTPASILQQLLEKRWELLPNDRDLVVMQHRIESVSEQGKPQIVLSSLQIEGVDNKHTAMAKTVGLPLAIGVRMMAEGKVTQHGLNVPMQPEWYNEILDELEKRFQIVFVEQIQESEQG
jgi:saccharopine dehydrogenase-like NADP-dependent oxidoreductase